MNVVERGARPRRLEAHSREKGFRFAFTMDAPYWCAAPRRCAIRRGGRHAGATSSPIRCWNRPPNQTHGILARELARALLNLRHECRCRTTARSCDRSAACRRCHVACRTGAGVRTPRRTHSAGAAQSRGAATRAEGLVSRRRGRVSRHRAAPAGRQATGTARRRPGRSARTSGSARGRATAPGRTAAR